MTLTAGPEGEVDAALDMDAHQRNDHAELTSRRPATVAEQLLRCPRHVLRLRRPRAVYLVLFVVGLCAAAMTARSVARGHYIFLPAYVRWTFTDTPPTGDRPTHIFVLVADHLDACVPRYAVSLGASVASRTAAAAESTPPTGAPARRP